MVQRNKGLNFTVRYKGGGNFSNALNPLARQNALIEPPPPPVLLGPTQVVYQVADGCSVGTTGSFISYFYFDDAEFTSSSGKPLKYEMDIVLYTTTGSLSASMEISDPVGVVTVVSSSSTLPERIEIDMSGNNAGIWSLKVGSEDPQIARALHGGTTIFVDEIA